MDVPHPSQAPHLPSRLPNSQIPPFPNTKHITPHPPPNIRKSRCDTQGAGTRCILDTRAKAKAHEQSGGTWTPGGAIGGKRRSSCAGGEARGRHKVFSATCTRWATARAAACPMAARACQKYLPQFIYWKNRAGSSTQSSKADSTTPRLVSLQTSACF